VFRVRFSQWADRAADAPLSYSLAYRATDEEEGGTLSEERTLVPAQVPVALSLVRRTFHPHIS
jgi:hypothetical protein